MRKVVTVVNSSGLASHTGVKKMTGNALELPTQEKGRGEGRLAGRVALGGD